MNAASGRVPVVLRGVAAILSWLLLLILSSTIVGYAFGRHAGKISDQIFSGVWWGVVLTFVPWLLTLPAILLIRRPFGPQLHWLLVGIVLPASVPASTFFWFFAGGNRVHLSLYNTAPVWFSLLLASVYAGLYLAAVRVLWRPETPSLR